MYELKLEQYLHRICKENSIGCLKLTGLRGIPDRLLIAKNFMVFVELKRETTGLEPMQKVVCKRIAEFGHKVFIVRTFEDVDTLINSITNINSLLEKASNEYN